MSTTPAERAELREIHNRWPGGWDESTQQFTTYHCADDEEDWPCDVIRLLDDLDASEAELRELKELAEDLAGCPEQESLQAVKSCNHVIARMAALEESQ
jgi:hypothetical protein